MPSVDRNGEVVFLQVVTQRLLRLNLFVVSHEAMQVKSEPFTL